MRPLSRRLLLPQAGAGHLSGARRLEQHAPERLDVRRGHVVRANGRAGSTALEDLGQLLLGLSRRRAPSATLTATVRIALAPSAALRPWRCTPPSAAGQPADRGRGGRELAVVLHRTAAGHVARTAPGVLRLRPRPTPREATLGLCFSCETPLGRRRMSRAARTRRRHRPRPRGMVVIRFAGELMTSAICAGIGEGRASHPAIASTEYQPARCPCRGRQSRARLLFESSLL